MTALLVGPAVAAGLFIGWLLVQRLWRRVFELPADSDALAGRCGCTSCPRADLCQRRDNEEKRHGS